MGGMGWALTANEEVEPSIFNFVTAPSIFLGQPRNLSKLKNDNTIPYLHKLIEILNKYLARR